MKRILYNQDGTVSIITPALKSKRENETEKEWLARVFDKATPKNIEYEDVEDLAVPIDREFRGAWTGKKGDGISVDEVKKQKIIDEKLSGNQK